MENDISWEMEIVRTIVTFLRLLCHYGFLVTESFTLCSYSCNFSLDWLAYKIIIIQMQNSVVILSNKIKIVLHCNPFISWPYIMQIVLICLGNLTMFRQIRMEFIWEHDYAFLSMNSFYTWKYQIERSILMWISGHIRSLGFKSACISYLVIWHVEAVSLSPTASFSETLLSIVGCWILNASCFSLFLLPETSNLIWLNVAFVCQIV